MNDELASIIRTLEERRSAVERAILALKEVGEVAAPTQAAPAPTATAEPTGRIYKISAEARERMRLGDSKGGTLIFTPSRNLLRRPR